MYSSRMHTARSSSRLRGGSASVHAGIHPPGVGLETPPRPDPSTFSLDVDLKTCKACLDTPTVNRITDTCKNITFPQLRLRVVTKQYNYRPQTKFAKVMFLQVSVCPQGGHAWLLPGGMCGCSGGMCMVALGGVCSCSGGHA